MKIKHIMKPLPGLHRYDVLVKDIAKAQGMDKGQRRQLLSEVQSAIALGQLTSRNQLTGGPLNVASGRDEGSPLVTVNDVNEWLKAEGRPYSAHEPLPVPTVAAPESTHLESTKERRARLLQWHEEEVANAGERGALARVSAREKVRRSTADRSNIGKDIRKAREERDEERRGGALARMLG